MVKYELNHQCYPEGFLKQMVETGGNSFYEFSIKKRNRNDD